VRLLGREGFLCLPCSTYELAGTVGVPPSRVGALEARAFSAQPESGLHVGTHAETRRGLASSRPYPASLAGAALRRQTPEVGAECLNWACSDLSGGRAVMREDAVAAADVADRGGFGRVA
jgi:hypothetical protein